MTRILSESEKSLAQDLLEWSRGLEENPISYEEFEYQKYREAARQEPQQSDTRASQEE